MNRLFFSGCILIMALFYYGCKYKNLPGRFSFNSNWQFVKLDHITENKAEIINQGTGWGSQYDVTHVASNTWLNVTEDVLKNELRRLKSSHWEDVSIPHTPYIEDLTVLNQWQGICFYRKQFIADEEWQGQICYIEFEGAMHLADVWINGKHLIQHAGGYTPFVIDVSNHLNYGESNEILIRLDNRNNPIIPPGKPLETLDFCYYGGIYRDVNFIVKNKIHITNPILANEQAEGGVFVTYPEVTADKALINIKTQVSNESGAQTNIEIQQSLIKIEGLFQDRKTSVEVATVTTLLMLNRGEARHIVQNIKIENPRLWTPDEPWLYLLRTEVLHDSKVVDSEEQRIGIRRISFSCENGFEINGQKIRLVGVNRHMEYPYVGNAISNQAQYRDIYHIKESGFNTVRLGHYPQHKSVLEACDELGLLAIEPIPGWQFFNENEKFVELTYRDIRDMIRRDRNHPSIVMWEVILNESWPPSWWKDKAAEVAHGEYPGDQCITSGDSYGYFGWDVQYNDWQEGFNRPNKSGKPGFIREYYDYEFGGHYSTTRVKRGDGERALLQNAWNAQWSHNRYRKYYPRTAGDAIWSMYDYNRGCCDNICHSGVADIFRLDKFSIPFFKSQMPVNRPLPSGEFGPYIFVANYWDNQTDDNKVVVFANVDEVELEINSKKVAGQKCDYGPDSDYSKTKEMWYKGGNPFDGGNCKQLVNPPFTFKNIEWESGEIKAIGYINGKEVNQHIVQTPGKPHQLTITYFESGKPAAKNDLLFVYIRVEDLNGTLCVNDSTNISLHIIEGGAVVGPDIVSAEAGIASFLVKTNETGRLVIQAKAPFDVKTKTWKLTQDYNATMI